MQRARGDEGAAEETLREALKWVPDSAALHHALGLALVRLQKPEEVLAELGRAARLDPSEPRFGYVYGIALEGVRGRQAARGELEGVLQRHPWHRDTRLALVAWCAEDGDTERVQELLQGLSAINPYDPALSRRQ
jgi:predicted Zn-dependent protease